MLSSTLEAIALKIPLHCPVFSIFKFPCPGCGMKKALLALFSGDVGLSLSYHPFVFVLIALIVLQVPFRTHKKLNEVKSKIYPILLLSLLSWWLYARIIPLWAIAAVSV